MSDSDSDISDKSCFCPWECMHSDSDSVETVDYEETSTDESSIDTHNTDEKDVYISIYDRIKNDYLILISNSTEIKNYRRSYSQLSQKSAKNIEKIWDDILLYNQIIGHISMKKYKLYINEYLKKNRDKKSNQNINKNIQININDTKKSVIVKNSCECQQPKIQQNDIKEVPKILSKKSEPKSQTIVNDKKPNSTQNIKNCPTKDKESNMNLINKKQNTNSNITDKKAKSTPINKKVIQNDSKNNNIKSENNTENKNSDNKSNINELKKPIDKVPQPISNNATIKAKIIDKTKNSCDANQINGTNINTVKLDSGSSKKKMKKQKQKEKKLENCKRDRSNSSSKEVSESSNKSSTKKTMNSKNNIKIEKINNIKLENKQSKDKDKKSANGKAKKNSKVHDSSQESDIDDSKATYISTSDDNMEFLTDSENIPTFFTEVVKRKVKGKNKTTKTTETIQNIDKKGDFVKPNKEDFTLQTVMKKLLYFITIV